MKIEGRWISGEDYELKIISCTKNNIFGRIKLTGNFLQIEKKFNGLILYEDDYEILFVFGLNLQKKADSSFKYLIIQGELNYKYKIMKLALTKYHNTMDKDQVETLDISLVQSE